MSARAAMPHAAAPTDGRTRSSVIMPSLKPRSTSPSSASAGHATGLETDAPERMRRRQHLRAREDQARCVGRHEERGDAAAARAGRRDREHDVDVGDAGVRDEMLVAVEHPPAAVAPRRGAHRRDVRSGVGLGHGECGHRAAAADRVEPSRALRVAAGEQERRAAERLQREHRVGQRIGRGDVSRARQSARRSPDAIGSNTPPLPISASSIARLSSRASSSSASGRVRATRLPRSAAGPRARRAAPRGAVRSARRPRAVTGRGASHEPRRPLRGKASYASRKSDASSATPESALRLRAPPRDPCALRGSARPS